MPLPAALDALTKRRRTLPAAWRRGSRPHGRGHRPPLPRFDPDSARRPPLPRFDPEQAARVWPPEPPAPATRGSPPAALHVLRGVAAPCLARSASPLPASRGCLPAARSLATRRRLPPGRVTPQWPPRRHISSATDASRPWSPPRRISRPRSPPRRISTSATPSVCHSHPTSSYFLSNKALH